MGGYGPLHGAVHGNDILVKETRSGALLFVKYVLTPTVNGKGNGVVLNTIPTTMWMKPRQGKLQRGFKFSFRRLKFTTLCAVETNPDLLQYNCALIYRREQNHWSRSRGASL